MYAKNAWKKYSSEELKKVNDFAEVYKKYISKAKTERELTSICVEELASRGYKDINTLSSINPGD